MRSITIQVSDTLILPSNFEENGEKILQYGIEVHNNIEKFSLLKNQEEKIHSIEIEYTQKIDSLNQVADFHNTFNAPILEAPQIPSEQRCQLRVALLQEELNELSQAIKENNLVEIADALCDLQYVLSGAVLEFGLGEKFEELFNEVQRSNMSKACSSEEEAKQTLALYLETDGTSGYYKKLGDRYVVYRDGDNKILKSINYSPANLKNIINK